MDLIDRLNSEDPHQEVYKGELKPKEWVYSLRMTETLNAFEPTASENVQLAVRAQHIERWKIARSGFPSTKVGYLNWRKKMGVFHGEVVARVLGGLGFSTERIEEVRGLLEKKGVKKNEEVQLLEDVACLVFLEHYLDDFCEKYPSEKVITIIQKTWVKMSKKGHKSALKLNFSGKSKELIESALA